MGEVVIPSKMGSNGIPPVCVEANKSLTSSYSSMISVDFQCPVCQLGGIAMESY